MKTQALLRDLLLVSVIFFMVLGIFKGPNAYRKIGQALEEDVGSVARIIKSTLGEQQNLIDSITEGLHEKPDKTKTDDVIETTKTTLSNYEEASTRLSATIFKWTAIFIIIVMVLICTWTIARMIIWSPETRF